METGGQQIFQNHSPYKQRYPFFRHFRSMCYRIVFPSADRSGVIEHGLTKPADRGAVNLVPDIRLQGRCIVKVSPELRMNDKTTLEILIELKIKYPNYPLYHLR
ncbi:hypothetical protein AJ80_07917 [Polytolypa hystricis UAMH7299]|uniref:Uncharacterized protein n=1 Tax=Polytolypa hystricis (strain UAMH7299) TaxID=1447883 RepID=A0A2B7XH80_POLH7|nr:hypothetical protein AJ80_07917 [Polytolypa hystricis UAMH7299]